MKVVYRPRTVTEEMDFALDGDRKISQFMLSAVEFNNFLEEGCGKFGVGIDEDTGAKSSLYKNIPVILAE